MEKGFLLWHPIRARAAAAGRCRSGPANLVGAVHHAPQTWSDGTFRNLYIRFERSGARSRRRSRSGSSTSTASSPPASASAARASSVKRADGLPRPPVAGERRGRRRAFLGDRSTRAGDARGRPRLGRSTAPRRSATGRSFLPQLYDALPRSSSAHRAQPVRRPERRPRGRYRALPVRPRERETAPRAGRSIRTRSRSSAAICSGRSASWRSPTGRSGRRTPAAASCGSRRDGESGAGHAAGRHDASPRLEGSDRGTRSTGTLPNGLAFDRSGDFLIANFGTDCARADDRGMARSETLIRQQHRRRSRMGKVELRASSTHATGSG